MAIKVNEIKLISGKDVCILQPTSAIVIISGKPVNLDGKLAAAVWKAVAPPAEKFFKEMQTYKPEA